MNPAEWLERSARIYPDAPALLTGTLQIADYAAFARAAAGIAAALRARGIGPGDRIALFARNSAAYLQAMYGAWWAGACVVPINAKLHPAEADFILQNSGARLVFTADTQLPGLDCIDTGSEAFAAMCLTDPVQAPHPMPPDALAWLFYTSGTTGKPKGVMLTAGNILAMVQAYFTDVDDVSPQDTALYAAPMSHGAGLYTFMHVIRGARHAVPPSGGFDADEILALAPRLGRVHMFAAPTMIRRLVDRARATGCTGEGLRTIVYGGGPMYLADIQDAVATLGPRFIQIYGQGESPMTISTLSRAQVADRSHPRWQDRLGSVGTAFSNTRLRVAGPDGTALPAGQIGEIMVQGPTVMTGYWRNPDATAKALRAGWLLTGDMGALDADGFLTLHDRSKDVVISGGTNIYPREVEEALLTHPAVAEAAVIGQPDPEWGENVVAFVVLRTPAAPADLIAHCQTRIARFKRPKVVHILPDLPKNNYGKVLKTDLRTLLASL